MNKDVTTQLGHESLRLFIADQWEVFVHLHALYSPRTALRTFIPRKDQIVMCGQYLRVILEKLTVAQLVPRLMESEYIIVSTRFPLS
jgi:hypothetical protein